MFNKKIGKKIMAVMLGLGLVYGGASACYSVDPNSMSDRCRQIAQHPDVLREDIRSMSEKQRYEIAQVVRQNLGFILQQLYLDPENVEDLAMCLIAAFRMYSHGNVQFLMGGVVQQLMELIVSSVRPDSPMLYHPIAQRAVVSPPPLWQLPKRSCTAPPIWELSSSSVVAVQV